MLFCFSCSKRVCVKHTYSVYIVFLKNVANLISDIFLLESIICIHEPAFHFNRIVKGKSRISSVP